MKHTENGTVTMAPNHTAVYQTAYPPFSDSWTSQCNDAWFSPNAGPRLTNSVRERLNLLGQELNAAIASWIDEFNGNFESERSAASPSFMKFVYQDERYNGHRFCREGVVEPDRKNNETCFFNLLSSPDHATNESTIVLKRSNVHGQQVLQAPILDPETCEIYPQDGTSGQVMSKAVASGALDSSTMSHSPLGGESIEKTFHPRYRAFKATTQELKGRLRYAVGPNSPLGHKELRIMCVGDYIAVGIGEDLQHNSYRPVLNELLISANNSVEFVGSQSRGDSPTDYIEGYVAASISDLHLRLKRNEAVRNYKPNMIVVTAGSADLRILDPHDYAGLNKTRVELETFIKYLLGECKGCVILLGDLPPPTTGFSWPPAPRQRQVLQFNAMISEVVNKIQTQHKSHHNGTRKDMLTKVHFTPATKDIQPDNGYPNNDGYLKMAYDIHERLWDANQRGWLHDAPSDQPLMALGPSTCSYWNCMVRSSIMPFLSYLQTLFIT
ncbi:unnamed protein product [Zymoseptoria tritici ST99CH_1E4]|uniref:SGNH hydrolase-type esterase domain-containing protein n=1 Tax=Zymoseptoria tritici ST99CH_1E4 TaxID=1276532 RepID=A0A2H1GUG5_ZYMTR|nr:unnamed protein product [Zymoseptoria tritici ST99CH_1E4]